MLITHDASLATGAASDDLTGTLRVHQDDFSMYNINVQNTFGQAETNGQAIAISAYGNRMGLYTSQFLSFQVLQNRMKMYTIYYLSRILCMLTKELKSTELRIFK